MYEKLKGDVGNTLELAVGWIQRSNVGNIKGRKHLYERRAFGAEAPFRKLLLSGRFPSSGKMSLVSFRSDSGSWSAVDIKSQVVELCRRNQTVAAAFCGVESHEARIVCLLRHIADVCLRDRRILRFLVPQFAV